MSTNKKIEKIELELRAFAMAYPEVTEDFPWGHRALKIKKKTFLFMATEGGRFSLSMKLPSSRDGALMFPFAAPTGYGLGKSGWVTSSFAPSDEIPVGILKTWIDESYRAIAPKKIVKGLGAAPGREAAGEEAPPPKKAAARRAPVKKAAKKAPAKKRTAAKGAAARGRAQPSRSTNTR